MSGKYLDSSKEVGTKVLKVAGSLVSKGTKALASYAGEALSACETKKAAADIQAKGELYNLERRAMREMPVLTLNQAQANQLESQTLNGFGMYPGPIQLDHAQADGVMNHMMKQHSLDAESREKLADAVTPLVGIPNMIRPLFKIHKLVATSWIIKDVNDIKGEKDLRPISYRNIVGKPLFIGTNRDISLVYNLQSKEICEFVYDKYQENGQYLDDVRLSLKDAGVEIKDVKSKGAFLEVTIIWTGA